MFGSTFKNTVKTILRSVTFWLVFALFAFLLVRYGVTNVSNVKSGAGLVFIDNYKPPEFLTYSGFISTIDNLVHAGSLMYPLAILVVIVTVLVVNRDHGDQLFEIEKAAGVKPLLYVLGRLSAVAAITFVIQWVVSFAMLQYIVFAQGGVEDMSALQCIVKGFLYLSRTNICIALPVILFYIGITYLIGTLFKNGVVAACVGFGYAIVFFVTFLLYRYSISPLAEVYFNYLSPTAYKIRHYFSSLGLPNQEQMLARFSTSLGKAMISIAFFVGVFAVCTAVSWVMTRKREA